MIPGDIGDLPTLACLNKPQKRALILRDQLRYLEPAHLDTFLNGVTTDEPPTYKNVNGTVYPPLAQVTIREEATRFDLGNVLFPEEDGATYRTHLTVEDERFEMRTEDALPKDDAELASVGIHRFVAENMFPLFKLKYKAIHARMEKINEARRVAYNMLNHPPAKFEDGETLARLTANSNAKDDYPRDGGSRKRKEVTKHISNKRQRVGLETIPDNVKSETFNTIPTQIKVDLFNNIIKTAFPNFDNLIVASWNVVSVYANVGSDFPELHKAVVELKGALEEFESTYAPSRTKSRKSRKEIAASQQTGEGASRTAIPIKEARSTLMPVTRSDNQTQEDDSLTDQHYQEDEDDSQRLMPPPRVLQVNQQHQDECANEDERQPEPPIVMDTVRPSARAHSVPRYTPEYSPMASKPAPNSGPASPNEQHLQSPRERVRKIRDRTGDSRGSPSTYGHLQAPGTELMRKRLEYTASLSKANRSSTGAALGHCTEEEEEDEKYQDDHANTREQRRLISGSSHGASLGSSILGAKRHIGSAPVAPMLPTWKDGGRANDGNGAGRRGY